MSTRTVRNFPAYTLEKSLSVAQKIQDENAGRPFKRLLLAEALGIKPASTNFRDILSSANKYGLIEGSEKSVDITLTPLGDQATNTKDRRRQRGALKKAALTPQVFNRFYTAFNNRKVSSPDMLRKLLSSDYNVAADYADECARIIMENGRLTGIIQDIGGSPHVLLDTDTNGDMDSDTVALDTSPLAPDMVDLDLFGGAKDAEGSEHKNGHNNGPSNGQHVPDILQPQIPSESPKPRPIFIGHGKNRGPLEKLEKILTTFKIPYKVVLDEPNLARPIPEKVRDVMLECNSAILIFTRDEKFLDENSNEIWRPSENVVHELGASSFAYENRVVILKEKGLTFPTNFNSIGYIEFDEKGLEAKSMELMQELIGLGLVKLMPV